MNHGYAEYFYRLAALFLSEGEVAITKENHKFFAMVSRLTGESIEQADFLQQVQLLVETGDLFLKRSMLHADADGSLPEQFNRYTGFGQGAPNLTWSHSSFLRAYDSRLKVKAAQTK